MHRTINRTGIIAALLLALLAPGCSSRNGGPGPTRPGWGIYPERSSGKATKAKSVKKKNGKKAKNQPQGKAKGKKRGG